METLIVLLTGLAIYLLIRIHRLNREVADLFRRTDYLNDVVRQLKGEAPAQPAAAPASDDHAKPSPAPQYKPSWMPPPAAAEPAHRAAPPADQPRPQPLAQSPAPAQPPPLRPGEWRATKASAPDTKSTPAPEPTPAQAPPPPPKKPRPTISWEQQIGARLPVWIGGIAIALSGIFLVKYSIDTGLLSPLVRCVLAGVLGLALLGAAQWIVARKTVANGERIAQALAGAGIAVLYGTLFAAGTVYGFFNPAVGFVGMALVTAVAVVLSLRHGPPIAMLGMVGGFLTPALVGAADPNPAVLFSYLTALTIGLFVVLRAKNWWWLAWPIVLACYAWVLIWLAGNGVAGDGRWIGLFLIALCVVTFTFVRPATQPSATTTPFAWHGLILTATAAVLLMTVVVVRGNFGVEEWALYGALAIGAVLLATWDQERYRFLPWMTMAPALTLLAVWNTPYTEFFVLVLTSFGLLFAVTGIVMIWRSARPLDWGGLACAAMLAFFGVAYARLYDVIDAVGPMASDAPIWGVVALALATCATLVAGRIAETNPGGRTGEAATTYRQLMLGPFALTALILTVAGLAIEIRLDHLPIAITGLIVAVAFVDARTNIVVLRPASVSLTILFGLLIAPQFMAPLGYAVRMIAGAPLSNVIEIPTILEQPLLFLGVPAVLLIAASLLMRRRSDDGVTKSFEVIAVFLTAVMGYFLIRLIDTPVEHVFMTPAPSGEGAIISQALLVFGMALIALAQRFSRQALLVCGVIAGVIAIARVVHFDVQPAQLWSVWLPMALGASDIGAVKMLPIAVAPIFYLGVPAVLLICMRLMLGLKRDDVLVRLAEYVAVIFIGLMGYFLIRQAFNPAADALTAAGSRLEGGVITQAQILYAIALIVAGRTFGRASLIHAAIVAAVMAALRIVFFDIKLFVLLGVSVQMMAGQPTDPALTSPAAAAPLFHLGLPALLLAALAYVARDEAKGWLARACEYTVVAFAGLMTYYLIRHAFNAPEEVFAGPGTYLERGVLTNAFLIVGAAAYVAGARFGRRALRIGGAISASLAVFRLGFFDIVTSSPLIRPHDVGSWPVINALLLPYGLPIVWLMLAGVQLAQRGLKQVVPAVHGAALLLLFALVSLNVRQLFQGPVLSNPGVAGDAEVYAYSIAWLVLGIGLLVAGAWRRDKILRFASLAVMVLTVGKVFLYDASALTGLLRVLSFLGLGLSLLGLSWFYTRYVFASEEAEKPAAS